MKVHVVGGAVRDELLQRPVQDRDHVVVGGTAGRNVGQAFARSARTSRFSCIRKATGNMLHALSARPRRATLALVFMRLRCHAGRGSGTPGIWTINAIARAGGSLIDPITVSRTLPTGYSPPCRPGLVEDPVRILRIARFAARFTDFSIAPETRALMSEMVGNGEVDALVPEWSGRNWPRA